MSRAMAVGMTAGLVAFIGLVVGQGFRDGDEGDPAGGSGVEATATASTLDPVLELDAGTDAYFAGEWDRAGEHLEHFREVLRDSPEAQVALRYLARTDLARGDVDGVRAALEALVASEPPMQLLLPTADHDSILDVYYAVRTDARRSPAMTPVTGIIVFDLFLVSDEQDPGLEELGSQVSQMLLSELGDGDYPWEVRYPTDALPEVRGERAYEFFEERILYSETMPATHAMFGRLAIRDGQLSVLARIYEMATGGIVVSGRETGVWPDDLFSAVEAVGASLREELLASARR